MNTLKLTSCMAGNADPFVNTLTEYLSVKLQLSIEPILGLSWQEREQRFDNGEIEICWICGLPYAWKADKPDSDIELLATPVLKASRYRNQAVYYSDIVVPINSHIQTFADLQGASWAYNEPNSHSGSYLMRSHLAAQGMDSSYLGKIIESGAHQQSLMMLLNGLVDASAIDSWVLELELARDPLLKSKIRIIDTLGPSGFPPFIISKQVPQTIRQALRQAMLTMDQDPLGRKILDSVLISHFTKNEDSDYDSIRHMAQQAQRVSWKQ
ncbi:PhnD/SsuA/transferrin family substrate-binding protein [Shewanella sp. D64]|uniref:phosphate/phosphite/phosphonate ABC transporter substrate-binding protein n=1 Tax=unclassified Shewanella TaxID=196818 RepID=UPI0022BA7188|nr:MULTISPECIES: PhnD/SsuA/transferrin family substrate-binding protein [unclassified Shewanella]MEC4728257.1 PhnD/SsuA/transferrin family substrate-binding protein [Shewanella sp. D64]MEC4739289.1 PhnD/SsuA/transferrin family substrate-binding protein [Shewanella sp. E94]WBJ97051.1 PhnD/SsuA/transferrin family substrate-binding protein [Shewanella sp. MTB7]